MMKRPRLTLSTNATAGLQTLPTVRTQDSASPAHVILVVRDLEQVVRLKVEVARVDASIELCEYLQQWVGKHFPATVPHLRRVMQVVK